MLQSHFSRKSVLSLSFGPLVKLPAPPWGPRASLPRQEPRRRLLRLLQLQAAAADQRRSEVLEADGAPGIRLGSRMNTGPETLTVTTPSVRPHCLENLLQPKKDRNVKNCPVIDRCFGGNLLFYLFGGFL